LARPAPDATDNSAQNANPLRSHAKLPFGVLWGKSTDVTKSLATNSHLSFPKQTLSN